MVSLFILGKLYSSHLARSDIESSEDEYFPNPEHVPDQKSRKPFSFVGKDNGIFLNY